MTRGDEEKSRKTTPICIVHEKGTQMLHVSNIKKLGFQTQRNLHELMLLNRERVFSLDSPHNVTLNKEKGTKR